LIKLDELYMYIKLKDDSLEGNYTIVKAHPELARDYWYKLTYLVISLILSATLTTIALTMKDHQLVPGLIVDQIVPYLAVATLITNVIFTIKFFNVADRFSLWKNKLFHVNELLDYFCNHRAASAEEAQFRKLLILNMPEEELKRFIIFLSKPAKNRIDLSNPEKREGISEIFSLIKARPDLLTIEQELCIDENSLEQLAPLFLMIRHENISRYSQIESSSSFIMPI
jgi:hypothetical protein